MDLKKYYLKFGSVDLLWNSTALNNHQRVYQCGIPYGAEVILCVRAEEDDDLLPERFHDEDAAIHECEKQNHLASHRALCEFLGLSEQDGGGSGNDGTGEDGNDDEQPDSIATKCCSELTQVVA